ncbi:MAG: glycosyltransferase family 4 protein [Thermodesulfobacteriota bacterium]
MKFKPSERKNILTVADVSMASVIGGAERVLYEQSIRLVRRGYAVHAMTRRLPVHGEEETLVEGIPERRYAVDFTNPFLFLLSNHRNGKKLFESLQGRTGFDAIIIHQPISAAGVIKSRRAKGIKKVYICHSLSFEEYVSRNKRPADLSGRLIYGMHVQIRKWMEKRALQHADEIIVLSQFTRDKLRGAYRIPPGKIAIIPGGVDLVQFKPAGDKASIRRALNLPDDKIVLFTVRNLVPRMGLENLIDALKTLVANAPDICLVIGGTGPLRHELERRAEELGVDGSIRFEGFIPEDYLPKYYQMADLFILPTRELEGFGLVTLEAMACGVPVLGTPVGGTLEIISQFDPGFLFPDSTPEAIAGLIAEKYHVIRNVPDRWREISGKARSFAEKNYSWDKHVDALEKHL